jgi:hypothetical protein
MTWNGLAPGTRVGVTGEVKDLLGLEARGLRGVELVVSVVSDHHV